MLKGSRLKTDRQRSDRKIYQNGKRYKNFNNLTQESNV